MSMLDLLAPLVPHPDDLEIGLGGTLCEACGAWYTTVGLVRL
jgi:LmbE family N-acetylglucosaminyl deacetylase